MGLAFKKYKRIFRRNLQPLFAVLVSRRRSMDKASWTILVEETLNHVVENPVEYVGSDLPHHQLLIDVLDEIRSDFLKESYSLLEIPKN